MLKTYKKRIYIYIYISNEDKIKVQTYFHLPLPNVLIIRCSLLQFTLHKSYKCYASSLAQKGGQWGLNCHLSSRGVKLYMFLFFFFYLGLGNTNSDCLMVFLTFISYLFPFFIPTFSLSSSSSSSSSLPASFLLYFLSVSFHPSFLP